MNHRLVLVILLAAALSLTGSLNLASRPAAVRTGKAGLATTISGLLFLVSRVANMLYLPLMAGLVDGAVENHDLGTLLQQVRLVIAGSILGNLVALLGLRKAIGVYEFLVNQLYQGGLKSIVRPALWWGCARQFWVATPWRARLGELRGVPLSFLGMNVLASAVWTIGGLSALYASAVVPKLEATAILLSGLVNAFAAITFSVVVDPKAGLITDESISRPDRPATRSPEQVDAMTLHLAAGNCLGGFLGLLLLSPAVQVVVACTNGLGHSTQHSGLAVLVALNALVVWLMCTTYAARVSAVQTGLVMTATAVYSLFFLVSRLAGQIYAPMMATMRDHLLADPARLLLQFRWVLAGATLGAVLGLLSLPTFVEVISQAVIQIERRGSITAVLPGCLTRKGFLAMLRCLRPPGLLGLQLADLAGLPTLFLLGNVVIFSVGGVGVMAAIYASTQVPANVSRTALLMSSVVNGVATIVSSLVVDPTLGRMTDQVLDGGRKAVHIRAAAVFLVLGVVLGTLLSQLLFLPSAWLIAQVSTVMVR